MSNTPLEQNGADLLTVLAAINELPEYQEIAPGVDLDFFSLYDAVKIAEWVDTVNIANDTTFDPTNYTDSTGLTTIRAATEQSASRSVALDIGNYIYIATLEWFIVPEYTEVPDKSYIIGNASVSAYIISQAGNGSLAIQTVYKGINWNGDPAGFTAPYGFYTQGSFVTVSNGTAFLTNPAIVTRVSNTMATADSFRAVNKANTDMVFRTRVYRLPFNQFSNAMRNICRNMIANEAFEGGA